LAIPARFREVVAASEDDCLVITNYDSCLWAFKRQDWRVIEEKAAELPQFNRSATMYLRYFISGAVECYIKQGRITIPPELRDTAGLRKEVVLVGQLKRFEIWDRERWEVAFERARAVFPEASQALEDLGI
jgi:MraZ protein